MICEMEKKVKQEIKNVAASQVPKNILRTSKTLQFFSPKLASLFASKIFTTPIKHKLPNREASMYDEAIKTPLLIPEIKKEVVVYEYGDNTDNQKKILLVHGWSGRGTQLFKFADAFIAQGFSVISFDAPGHGDAKANTAILTDFIASILYIQQKYGPFEVAVGHSLGGMAMLNSVPRGLNVTKMAVIGSADVVKDVIDEFIAAIGLKGKIANIMEKLFEKRTNTPMAEYSSYISAQRITIPVLVIHDENDAEVSIDCAHHINQNLQNGDLYITKGLGHRKILGSTEVIAKAVDFLK
jgi:pimeloyl-ACP methyl ester carboxylesterase